MPDLTLEHSAEIAETVDMSAVTKALFDTALATGEFGDGKSIKVRSIPCYNVVTGKEPQTIASLTLRLLPGRSVALRREIAEKLLAVLAEHLPEVGSVSVHPIELNADVYVKRVL